MRHHFILQDGTAELLSDEVRRRIEEKGREASDCYDMGYWSEEDVFKAVKDAIDGGFYPKEKTPPEFRKRMNELFKNPERYGWDIAERDGSHREPMERQDLLLVGGVVASSILTPDEFWADVPGFSGGSDVHAAIGILALKNRDLFFERGGGEWKSEHDGYAYTTRVTGSMHGDLRIERIRESFLPTRDPFGNDVRYRPMTDRDKEYVSGYHSTEPELLVAILHYIDELRLDVPCLRDGGKALLQELGGRGQFAGNFADFGTDGISGPESLFFGTAFPMATDPKAERTIFHHIVTEGHGSYRIHVDERKHLAFTYVSKKGEVGDSPELTLPPEEMDQFVRALLTQTQQGKGRTSLRQMRRLLEFRYSNEYHAEMEKIRSEMRRT